MKAVFVVTALVLCACALKLPKPTLLKPARHGDIRTETFTPKPVDCAYTIRFRIIQETSGEISDVSGYDCGYGDSAIFTTVTNTVEPYETSTYLRADINGGEEGQALEVSTMNSSYVQQCFDMYYTDNKTEIGYIWEYVEGEVEYDTVEKGEWAGEECDVYYFDGYKDMHRTYVKDERIFGIYRDSDGIHFEFTSWYDGHAYADDYVVSSSMQGCSAGVYQPIVRLDDCPLEDGSHPVPPPDPPIVISSSSSSSSSKSSSSSSSSSSKSSSSSSSSSSKSSSSSSSSSSKSSSSSSSSSSKSSSSSSSSSSEPPEWRTFTPKPLDCGYTMKYKLKMSLAEQRYDIRGYECGYNDSSAFTADGTINGVPAKYTTLLRADINGGVEGQALQVYYTTASGVNVCTDDGYVDNQTNVGMIYPYVETSFMYNKVEKDVWAGEECDAYYIDGMKNVSVYYIKDERVFGIYQNSGGVNVELTCWYDGHAYANDFVVSKSYQGCSAGVYQPIQKRDDCAIEDGSHPSDLSPTDPSSDSTGSNASAAFSLKAFAFTVLAMVMGVLISSF